MIGVSFNPANAGQPQAPGTAPGSPRPLVNPTATGTNISPLQSAIRTLSLRLPTALGPSPVAPGALLTSPGGTGFGGGALGPPPGQGMSGVPGQGPAGAPFDLLAFLHHLLGGGATDGGLPAVGQAPVPSVAFGGNPVGGANPALLPGSGGGDTAGFHNWLNQFHGLNPNAPSLGQPALPPGLMPGPGGPR